MLQIASQISKNPNLISAFQRISVQVIKNKKCLNDRQPVTQLKTLDGRCNSGFGPPADLVPIRPYPLADLVPLNEILTDLVPPQKH